jgi:hypothetical protein
MTLPQFLGYHDYRLKMNTKPCYYQGYTNFHHELIICDFVHQCVYIFSRRGLL